MDENIAPIRKVFMRSPSQCERVRHFVTCIVINSSHKWKQFSPSASYAVRNLLYRCNLMRVPCQCDASGSRDQFVTAFVT